MLHYAATIGDSPVVDDLLRCVGVECGVTDCYQCVPYALAMRNDHFDIALKILNRWQPARDYGAGTFGTLLHLAVYKMQANHVYKLLQLIKYDFVDIEQGDGLINTLVASKRNITT